MRAKVRSGRSQRLRQLVDEITLRLLRDGVIFFQSNATYGILHLWMHRAGSAGKLVVPCCQYVSKDDVITRFLHRLIFSMFSEYLNFVGFWIGVSWSRLKEIPVNTNSYTGFAASSGNDSGLRQLSASLLKTPVSH